MKRKSYAWIYLVVLSLGTILSLYIPKQETAAQDAMVIPSEAIRLRILANSDKAEDQAVKRKIRDAVNAEITKWVESLTSIDDARDVIKSHLPEIEEIAKAEMKNQHMNQTINVTFGKVNFPTKLYGQYLYPAGEYEAILITLGKGKGANWWCVLYPPLCFLDFSNGVAVSEGFEEKTEQGNTAKAAEKAASEQKEENSNADDQQNAEKDSGDIQTASSTGGKEESPVYAGDEEQKVEVKFFVVELFEKLF